MVSSRMVHLRRYLTLASIAVYLLALPLPVVYGAGSGEPTGLAALVFGPLAFLGGMNPYWTCLSWLANVTWVAALVTGSYATAQRVLAVSSVSLAALFLAAESILVNTAGSSAKLTGPGPGYILWLAALGLLIPLAWAPASRVEQA